jgi:hypothetical protein
VRPGAEARQPQDDPAPVGGGLGQGRHLATPVPYHDRAGRLDPRVTGTRTTARARWDERTRGPATFSRTRGSALTTRYEAVADEPCTEAVPR